MSMPPVITGYHESLNLLYVVWQRKLAVIVVSCLIFSSAALYIFSITPLFEATALVQVAPSSGADPFGRQQDRFSSQTDPPLIRTEIEVLASGPLSRRVIDHLSTRLISELDGTTGDSVSLLDQSFQWAAAHLGLDWISRPDATVRDPQRRLDRLVRAYQGRLSIYNDNRSTLARIAFVAQDAKLASEVANTHARFYLANRIERRLESTENLNARLISPAVEPSRPTFPRTRLLLLVAFIASACVGIAVAIMIHWLSPGIQDFRNLAGTLGIQPLGTIPLPKRRRGAPQSTTHPLFLERVRAIRNMLLPPSMESGSVILITSCLPQEGKSVMAVSLARATAATGASTLLIDTNLRSPLPSSLVGAINPPLGLTHLLRGEVSFEEAVLSTEGLDVLFAGQDDNPPVDLLSWTQMRQILEVARQRYEIIIVDTPPVGAVSDALAFAPLADQVVLVVRSGVSSLKIIRDVLRRFHERSADVTGLVYTGEVDENSSLLKIGELRRQYHSRNADIKMLVTANAIRTKSPKHSYMHGPEATNRGPRAITHPKGKTSLKPVTFGEEGNG